MLFIRVECIVNFLADFCLFSHVVAHERIYFNYLIIVEAKEMRHFDALIHNNEAQCASAKELQGLPR